MTRTMKAAALLAVLAMSFGAFAQEGGAPKNWSKLSKGWIAALEAEGTYDPSDPANVPQRTVDSLLAVQKQAITPEYLKRIDKSGALLGKVAYWAAQGVEGATIAQRVLATPEAVKTPPRGAKKAKKN